MPRFLIIGLMTAALSTPTLAASNLDASSLRVESQSAAQQEATADKSVDFARLFEAVSPNIEKSTDLAEAGARATTRPRAKQNDEGAKSAERDNAGETKKQKQVGPEPVYLAF
ncbi:MAG: hypothetical protein AB7P23_05945 [Amphiplicatus sp.]